jgi:hypothetical protein
MTDNEFPEFDEMGIAAVRLLQGVVYEDDEAAWDVLLSNESRLETWFAKIGLALIIDRGEGLAWLKQLDEAERSEGYERLPRLFRKTPLTYAATLLCVLLRDEYRQFEDEDVDNNICVVETASLLDAWKPFFPGESDEVQLRRSLVTELNRLEKLKFVRKLGSDSAAWEVRKLLKARLPLHELEELRDRMMDVARAAQAATE